MEFKRFDFEKNMIGAHVYIFGNLIQIWFGCWMW